MAMESITIVLILKITELGPIVLILKITELGPKPFLMDALPATQVRNPTTNSNLDNLESPVLATKHNILQISLNIISLTAPS